MTEHKPILTYDIESAMAVATNNYQGESKRVLCVCSAGILRSATSAVVLSQDPYNFNTRSCGVEPYALIPLTKVLLHWADEVVCMTEYHKAVVEQLTRKPVICLDIPDSFAYREPQLVKLIRDNYPKLGIRKEEA